jgi:hypothetical protein
VNLKSKILGVLGAAVIAAGFAAPTLAADRDFEYQITANDTLTVAFDGGTNFAAKSFTVGNASPQYSASYTYTVTDLRGTGDGWNVKASTAGFFNSDDVAVPGAVLHATNLTKWSDGLGYTADTNAITNGVSTISSWSPSLIGDGRVLIKATPGLYNGVFPNGTGVFHSGDALYLEFPFGVAADTYTATLQLTISSGDQP